MAIATHDPVVADLRRFEIEQVQLEAESERKQSRIDETVKELRASFGDFLDAYRETGYANERTLQLIHIAHVSGDTAEIGRIVSRLLDKEYLTEAERQCS